MEKTSTRVVEELFPWNTPKIEAALLYCMNMLAYYINKKWHLQNKYFPHKQEKCFYWAKGPRFNTPSLVSTKNTGIRFASIIPYPDHTRIGAVSVYCHIKKKNRKISYAKPHQHTSLGFIKKVYIKWDVLKYNTKNWIGNQMKKIQHWIGL